MRRSKDFGLPHISYSGATRGLRTEVLGSDIRLLAAVEVKRGLYRIAEAKNGRIFGGIFPKKDRTPIDRERKKGRIEELFTIANEGNKELYEV